MKRRHINFSEENTKRIQKFANDNCDGTFSKAVQMLCLAQIELHELAKKHNVNK